MGRQSSSLPFQGTASNGSGSGGQGSHGLTVRGKQNPVTQLALLREFVSPRDGGDPSWSEEALVDCLKTCGYNVERAAECLVTGQYIPRSARSGGRHSHQGKSAFFQHATEQQTSVPSRSSTSPPRRSIPSTGSGRKSPPLRRVAKQPRTDSQLAHVSPSQAQQPSSPSRVRDVVPPTTGHSDGWLLCQRWLSDSLCLTKHGSVDYQEPLALQHSLTGHPTVRFRGARMEGRLPENVAALLTPLLRYHTPDSSSSSPLLRVTAQALMEDYRVPIGAPVPLSLTVAIVNVSDFFALLALSDDDHTHAATKASQYFAQTTVAHPPTTKVSRQRLTVAQAAFQLLQWAEYGDVPEFAPVSTEETEETTGSDKDSDHNDDMEYVESSQEMDDLELEESSVAPTSEEVQRMEASVVAHADWASRLPEAQDPPGLAAGVTLRSYQKQALYWMWQRETVGDSHADVEEQLALLAELATSQPNHASTRSPFSSPPTAVKDIECDCGPVLVSPEARKQARTFDHVLDPVHHPLWTRRYVTNHAKTEARVFYVNELLGVATHEPPGPPQPCSGGILADSMGLGKTVMLLALILRSKQERSEQCKPAAAANGQATKVPGEPITTLVVAKLSLLPQWEDELRSKTSLSFTVYYGSQGSRTPTREELESVDVVVTTYGTIQGETKRKNPILAKCRWLRVVLDEAHCIRNQQTLASKVCCELSARHRWCVSGTIIQNSLDDVYGVIKFLRHEPWCIPGFWKAAITQPLNSAKDESDPKLQSQGLQTALDRIRRLLAPMMLRRTKDSISNDGKPILTLPPVETKIVKVDLSESEREFYNAVLARSLEVFDGFLQSGTAAKSYIQIFGLLQRLRQVCDHIALTVRSRIDDDRNVTEQEEYEAIDVKESPKKPPLQDALGNNFLEGLLEKFCSKQVSPRKQTRKDGENESPAKRPKDHAYLSQVAQTITQAVEGNATHIQEECPVCLDNPKIQDAVVTPCGHIFCKTCLIGCLREKASGQTTPEGMAKPPPSIFQCPDGPCPSCNEVVRAKRIVAFKPDVNGDLSSSFLTNVKSSSATAKLGIRDKQQGNTHVVARQILENAIQGDESSKMRAIIDELDAIWELDPGSKVLIFSQYLGFLDLLGSQFSANGIHFFRLDGSLSLKARITVLEEFRVFQQAKQASVNGDACRKGTVMLMSMGAGGEGLNLVAASSVFIADPWWNAAKEDQCVNRIHRIGQLSPVVRVRKFVVTDSVEERIVELQSRKKYVAEEVYNDVGKPGDLGSSRLGLEEFKLIFRK